MNYTVTKDEKSKRSNCATPFHALNNIWNMDGRETRLIYERDFLRQMSAFGMPTLVRLPVDPNFEYPLTLEQLVAAGVEQYVVEDYKGYSWYPHDLLVLAGVVESAETEVPEEEEEIFEEPIVLTYVEPESLATRYSKLIGSCLKNWYRSCVAGTRYLRSHLVQAKRFARKKLKCLYKERE